MQKFLILCGILSFIALYALTQSTDSNSPYAPYFWTIAGFTGALAVAMLLVTLRYIWHIARDKRNHVFGSQIARRLSSMFAIVAALPALFLLGVAAQFIAHSINSWFGNDTKEALERSLKLSQTALDNAAGNSVQAAQRIRANLATALVQNKAPNEAFQTQLAREFSHLAIWQLNGHKLIAERNPQKLPAPDFDPAILKSLQQQQIIRSIENVNGTLYASGWIMLPKYVSQQYIFFFRQPIPESVAKDAELIESARAKYAELVFAQKGLQTFFLATLLIAALLAILLSLAAALYFARRFVEPILALADGARSVAHNDFSRRIPVNSQDELGKLAGMFNYMTQQLANAQYANERHRKEQEAARHYLERVLSSLSAGVITLGYSGSLKTYNASAENMLDINLAQLIGEPSSAWQDLSPQHHAAANLINALIASEHNPDPVELSYTAQDSSRILLGKAIRLPAENGKGLVLVFDNITELVRAQKEAAWGEVAKRLAHEIRNPLTPIQLSAERLAWKLQDKLDTKDAQILTKSTDTIIKQVAALKEMVEAFRNYARAPRLKLTETNLNALVSEVLVLYESSPCQFIADFSPKPAWIKADTTAMRQVLHNLFKNAAEAAESDPQPETHIQILVHETTISLTVTNNGKSFTPQMLQNAFEPYVTDKPAGTGLGLPVVKKIIEEHGGHISIANQIPSGANISITLPKITTTEAENS